MMVSQAKSRAVTVYYKAKLLFSSLLPISSAFDIGLAVGGGVGCAGAANSATV